MKAHATPLGSGLQDRAEKWVWEEKRSSTTTANLHTSTCGVKIRNESELSLMTEGRERNRAEEPRAQSAAARILTDHAWWLFAHAQTQTQKSLTIWGAEWWLLFVFVLCRGEGLPKGKGGGGGKIHLAYQKKFRWLSWPIGHLGNRQRRNQISPRTGHWRRFCGRWRLSPGPPESRSRWGSQCTACSWLMRFAQNVG